MSRAPAVPPNHVPMCVPHIPLYVTVLAIRSWEEVRRQVIYNTSGAPESRYHGSVTLHPVHVSVRKRTHSVQGGSLLSHTVVNQRHQRCPRSTFPCAFRTFLCTSLYSPFARGNKFYTRHFHNKPAVPPFHVPVHC